VLLHRNTGQSSDTLYSVGLEGFPAGLKAGCLAQLPWADRQLGSGRGTPPYVTQTEAAKLHLQLHDVRSARWTKGPRTRGCESSVVFSVG
jgi:hypothetical protein